MEPEREEEEEEDMSSILQHDASYSLTFSLCIET